MSDEGLKMPPTTIVTVSVGASAVGPSTHEEGSVMYFGYQTRIRQEDYETTPPHEEDAARLKAVTRARTLLDGTLVERAADLSVERIATLDWETGDFLVTWRVPFRLVQEEQRA
jgi:hypothetical protein